MSLSNTAVPKYYGAFREAVLRGDIPICAEIEMEMWRIDKLLLQDAAAEERLRVKPGETLLQLFHQRGRRDPFHIK